MNRTALVLECLLLAGLVDGTAQFFSKKLNSQPIPTILPVVPPSEGVRLVTTTTCPVNPIENPQFLSDPSIKYTVVILGECDPNTPHNPHDFTQTQKEQTQDLLDRITHTAVDIFGPPRKSIDKNVSVATLKSGYKESLTLGEDADYISPALVSMLNSDSAGYTRALIQMVATDLTGGREGIDSPYVDLGPLRNGGASNPIYAQLMYEEVLEDFFGVSNSKEKYTVGIAAYKANPDALRKVRARIDKWKDDWGNPPPPSFGRLWLDDALGPNAEDILFPN